MIEEVTKPSNKTGTAKSLLQRGFNNAMKGFIESFGNVTDSGSQQNRNGIPDINVADPGAQATRMPSEDPQKPEEQQLHLQQHSQAPATRIDGENLVKNLEKIHQGIIDYLGVIEKNTSSSFEYIEKKIKGVDASIVRLTEKTTKIEKKHEEHVSRFDREIKALKQSLTPKKSSNLIPDDDKPDAERVQTEQPKGLGLKDIEEFMLGAGLMKMAGALFSVPVLTSIAAAGLTVYFQQKIREWFKEWTGEDPATHGGVKPGYYNRMPGMEPGLGAINPIIKWLQEHGIGTGSQTKTPIPPMGSGGKPLGAAVPLLGALSWLTEGSKHQPVNDYSLVRGGINAANHPFNPKLPKNDPTAAWNILNRYFKSVPSGYKENEVRPTGSGNRSEYEFLKSLEKKIQENYNKPYSNEGGINVVGALNVSNQIPGYGPGMAQLSPHDLLAAMRAITAGKQAAGGPGSNIGGGGSGQATTTSSTRITVPLDPKNIQPYRNPNYDWNRPPGPGTTAGPLQERVLPPRNNWDNQQQPQDQLIKLGRASGASSDVLAQAAQIAKTGNVQAVREYMARAGIRNAGEAYCAEFVSAVQKNLGWSMPRGNPNTASTWEGWGIHADKDHIIPGAILVNTRGHRIGDPGGHTMRIDSINHDGTVNVISANITRRIENVKVGSDGNIRVWGETYDVRVPSALEQQALKERESRVASGQLTTPVNKNYDYNRTPGPGTTAGPLQERQLPPSKGWDTTRPQTSDVVRPDYRGQQASIAIRANNPGNQWPDKYSAIHGSTGDLGMMNSGRDKPAIFPDAISGAASMLDKLNGPSYRNLTATQAIRRWWTGDVNGGDEATAIRMARSAGVEPNASISSFIDDPQHAISYAKAIAKLEAGREYPMSGEQWAAAYSESVGKENTQTQISKSSGIPDATQVKVPQGYRFDEQHMSTDMKPYMKDGVFVSPVLPSSPFFQANAQGKEMDRVLKLSLSKEHYDEWAASGRLDPAKMTRDEYAKMNKVGPTFAELLKKNPDKIEMRPNATPTTTQQQAASPSSGSGSESGIGSKLRMWQHDYTGQGAALTDTSAFVKPQLRGRHRPHSPQQQYDITATATQQSTNEQQSSRSQSFGEWLWGKTKAAGSNIASMTPWARAREKSPNAAVQDRFGEWGPEKSPNAAVQDRFGEWGPEKSPNAAVQDRFGDWAPKQQQDINLFPDQQAADIAPATMAAILKAAPFHPAMIGHVLAGAGHAAQSAYEAVFARHKYPGFNTSGVQSAIQGRPGAVASPIPEEDLMRKAGADAATHGGFADYSQRAAAPTSPVWGETPHPHRPGGTISSLRIDRGKPTTDPVMAAVEHQEFERLRGRSQGGAPKDTGPGRIMSPQHRGDTTNNGPPVDQTQPTPGNEGRGARRNADGIGLCSI